MVEITLYDKNDKPTTHKAGKVRARVLKETMKVVVRAEQNELSEMDYLDEIVRIIVLVFNNKAITEDTIYDGIYAEDFNSTIDSVVSQIMGGVTADSEAAAEGK